MNFKQYIPNEFSRYDFKRVHSGMEGEVYIGFDGEKKIVLKRGPDKVGGYYRIEGSIYKEMKNQGIKAPRFVFEDDGKNILMISFMEGKELNDNHDLFENKLIWKGAAKDLALLRNIDCIGFGEIKNVLSGGVFRGSLDNWGDFFRSTNDFMPSAEIVGIVASGEIKPLQEYWVENRDKISLKKGNIVHGDFCMDHIWTVGGKYAGLIDFGDVFIGDHLMDLAYFKLKEINKDYGKKTFDSLYISYSDLFSDDRSEEEKKTLINLYMIYWGINRMIGVSNESMKRKFGEKIKTLIRSL